MTLDIKSVEDIKRVKQAILENEDFELGVITPITYIVKLDGGRFDHYDTAYIDADIAKVILSHQENYTKLLNELERHLEIQFSEEDRILKFKLQDGCLEFVSDLLQLEGLKKMKSKHLMYVILGVSLMWFGHSAYNTSIEAEIKKVETAAEIEIEKLDAGAKEAYTDTINNAVEALKTVALNKNIQNAINKPKQATLSILKEGENAIFDDVVLTKENEASFNYSKPNVDDIEEVPAVGTYTIEYYNFIKDGKLFKIQGITPPANSEILTPEKRMKLMAKADNKESVNIEVKIIRDGISKKIKTIYILDFIEN